MGGWATDSNDGQSTYAWPSNVSNVPVELIERNARLFVVRKALRPNSGGAGRYRGGLGQEIEFEVTSETPIGIIFMAERCRFPAQGIDGGEAGARGEVLIDGVSVDYRKNVVLKKGSGSCSERRAVVASVTRVSATPQPPTQTAARVIPVRERWQSPPCSSNFVDTVNACRARVASTPKDVRQRRLDQISASAQPRRRVLGLRGWWSLAGSPELQRR